MCVWLRGGADGCCDRLYADGNVAVASLAFCCNPRARVSDSLKIYSSVWSRKTHNGCEGPYNENTDPGWGEVPWRRCRLMIRLMSERLQQQRAAESEELLPQDELCLFVPLREKNPERCDQRWCDCTTTASSSFRWRFLKATNHYNKAPSCLTAHTPDRTLCVCEREYDHYYDH